MDDENEDISELIDAFRERILALQPDLTEREIEGLVREALKEPFQS